MNNVFKDVDAAEGSAGKQAALLASYRPLDEAGRTRVLRDQFREAKAALEACCVLLVQDALDAVQLVMPSAHEISFAFFPTSIGGWEVQIQQITDTDGVPLYDGTYFVGRALNPGYLDYQDGDEWDSESLLRDPLVGVCEIAPWYFGETHTDTSIFIER